LEKQMREHEDVSKNYEDCKDEIKNLDLKINVDAKKISDSKAEQSNLDEEIKKLESELKTIGRG
jgi:peptidoglycan hydrolase CwlO-like protein